MVLRPVPGPGSGPGNKMGKGKWAHFPSPLARWTNLHAKKSETRIPATRIATRPNGKSLHIMVSFPARLILARAGRLSPWGCANHDFKS